MSSVTSCDTSRTMPFSTAIAYNTEIFTPKKWKALAFLKRSTKKKKILATESAMSKTRCRQPKNYEKESHVHHTRASIVFSFTATNFRIFIVLFHPTIFLQPTMEQSAFQQKKIKKFTTTQSKTRDFHTHTHT